MNISCVARLRGDVPKPESLRRGLLLAQARHPLLRVAIDERDSTQPVFVQAPGRKTSLHIAEKGESWRQIVEQEITQPFDVFRGPLSRAVWVHSDGCGYLVVTLHHSIGDAKSAVFYARDVLAGAAFGPNESHATLSDFTAADPLENRLTELATGWRGRFAIGRFAASELMHLLTHGKASTPRHDVEVSSVKCVTILEPRERSSEWVTTLLHRTRAEYTTATCAMLAAIALTVAADKGEESIDALLWIPMDLRSTLEPPVGEDVGMYVSMAQFRKRIYPGDDFWSLARAIRRSITKDRTRKHDHVMARAVPMWDTLLRGANRTPKEFAMKFGEMIPSTSGLTNLGKLNVRTNFGEFEVEAYHFSVGLTAAGSYMCSATSTQGRLNWNFMFSYPQFTREHACAVADETIKLLERAVVNYSGI